MVILVLDFENEEKTLKFLSQFSEQLFVKVGMELFYSSGPRIIKEIKKLGHKIFLDLKLHDIPNTVTKAIKNLAKLDVDIINLHASGGIKMMEEAKKALQEQSANKKTLLIAVTQLTSISQEIMNQELLINGDINDVIVKYALNAQQAGLDGVVCSPLEVPLIKEKCGSDFITVTPGIRLEDSLKDDQVRIATPKMARELGCDYIVVGRPITKAENPVQIYNQIKKDFTGE